MRSDLRSSAKIGSICLMIAAVTALHYTTSMHRLMWHIVFRELYLVPIFFGAYWYGRKGGLLTSMLSSILYIQCALMASPAPGTYHLNNLFSLLVFNVFGYVYGNYRDVKRARFQRYRPSVRAEEAGPSEEAGRLGRVLVCIDNIHTAEQVVHRIVQLFRAGDGPALTLMGLVPKPSGDFFEDRKEREAVEREVVEAVEKALDAASTVLASHGLDRSGLERKTVRLSGRSLSDVILEEQQREGHDMIVVGGTKMSKSEEFLFGNVAVRLVRAAPCPVLTVY